MIYLRARGLGKSGPWFRFSACFCRIIFLTKVIWHSAPAPPSQVLREFVFTFFFVFGNQTHGNEIVFWISILEPLEAIGWRARKKNWKRRIWLHGQARHMKLSGDIVKQCKDHTRHAPPAPPSQVVCEFIFAFFVACGQTDGNEIQKVCFLNWFELILICARIYEKWS